MQAGQPPRMPERKPGGDRRADVAALRAEALVAEAGHQLGPRIRDHLRIDAGALGRRRKAISRQRRHHHVEPRIDEQREKSQHLQERPRPAVRDQERQPACARVEEVDAQAVDLLAELGPAVHFALGGAPVVPAHPAGHGGAQPVEIDAALPTCAQRNRKARAREPLAQVGEHFVRDVDRERLHGASSQWGRGLSEAAIARERARGLSRSDWTVSLLRSPWITMGLPFIIAR